MNKPYKYDPLAADEIRLLRLRPADLEAQDLEGQLVTCRLVEDEDPPPVFRDGREVLVASWGDYDAVSYFWGKDDSSSSIKLYDGVDAAIPKGNVPIGTNLNLALRTIRRHLFQEATPYDTYLWIDALCMNQKDVEEKSSQIRKMSLIYNKAGRVRVWLGPGSEQTNKGMDFVDELIDLDRVDEISVNTENSTKWAAFRELVRSDWFERRWIIQEIALARDARVYCGDKQMSWESFVYAVSIFTSKAPQLKKLFHQAQNYHFRPDYLGELDALGANVLVEISQSVFRKSENGEIVEHLFSLERLISALTMFKATKPHDTIYAILSLAYDAHAGSKRSALAWPQIHSPLPSPRLERQSYFGGPAFTPQPMATQQLNVRISDADQVQSPMHVPQNLMWGNGIPEYQHEHDRHRTGSDGHKATHLKPPLANRPTRDRTNSVTSLRMAEGEAAQKSEPFPVDYDLPLFEVCRQLIEFAVRQSKSLDIICTPWAPEDADLPSWIPSVSGRAYKLRRRDRVYERVAADPLVGILGRTPRNYSASGKVPAYKAPFNANSFFLGRGLHTRGFVLDEIHEVGGTATEGNIPSEWTDLVGWHDPELDPVPQAFWRTIVADRDLGGIQGPPPYFPLACTWAFGQRSANDNLRTQLLLNELKCPSVVQRFLRRTLEVVWNRKLILTRGTEDRQRQTQTLPLIALVPDKARAGDIVAILHGFSVPVVLRKCVEDSPASVRRRVSFRSRLESGSLKRRPHHSPRPAGRPGEATLPSTSSKPAVSPARSEGALVDGDADGPDPQPGKRLPGLSIRTATLDKEENASQFQTLRNMVGDLYEFIGESYVHGMMAGEAFKHKADTGHPDRDFWLI